MKINPQCVTFLLFEVRPPVFLFLSSGETLGDTLGDTVGVVLSTDELRDSIFFGSRFTIPVINVPFEKEDENA